MGNIIIPINRFSIECEEGLAVGQYVFINDLMPCEDDNGELNIRNCAAVIVPEASIDFDEARGEDVDYLNDKLKEYSRKNRNILRKIIVLLRLFCESSSYANCILYRKDLVGVSPKLIHWNDRTVVPDVLPHFKAWKGEKRKEFQGELKITSNLVSSFTDFFIKFDGMPIDDFAVSQFVFADFEPYDNDMFMRYVACLEYLFVPDGKRGEINYKFRSRISMLAGNNVSRDGRELLFKELGIIYDIRSALTHGESIKYRADDYLRILRCLCRDWIKRFYIWGVLSDHEERLKKIKDFTVFRPVLDLPGE